MEPPNDPRQESNGPSVVREAHHCQHDGDRRDLAMRPVRSKMFQTPERSCCRGFSLGLPLKEFFLVLSSGRVACLGEWRAVGSHVHRDKPEKEESSGACACWAVANRLRCPAPAMNLGTVCADTWYRDFAIFPPGAGSRRLRSFKQAAFLLRRPLRAERCPGVAQECPKADGTGRPYWPVLEHHSSIRAARGAGCVPDWWSTSASYEDRLRIPVWNRRAGDHQPEDNQHGCERRKSEGEPPPKKSVIPGGQLGVGLYRTDGKIAHLHLHPHHR